MDIIIQSLGFKAGEALETFIREKINGVKDDKVVRANVVLYKGPASNPENDYCEIRLEVPGNDHFVKKHSLYFETAVSECVDILSQMIKKSKEKSGNKRSDKESVMMDENLPGLHDDFDLEDVVKK
ncbi:MAG: HPF/RaiA family ribosome-associated protein [Ferruginibacter sp.]|nr:HPF/RaiA family ribosome-associated protein [Ferruginibacter sp.]